MSKRVNGRTYIFHFTKFRRVTPSDIRAKVKRIASRRKIDIDKRVRQYIIQDGVKVLPQDNYTLRPRKKPQPQQAIFVL